MKLKQLEKNFALVVEGLSVFMMVIVVLLVICQVIFRYVLQISVPWTEELARALYVWVVFIAVVLLERDDGQIRTMLLINKLPPKLYIFWEIIVCIASVIFNVCVFIGSIIAMINTNMTLGSLPFVSLKMFYIPIIFGMPFMVMYQVINIISKISIASANHPKVDQL